MSSGEFQKLLLKRLPTKEQLITVFWVCVFPIHVWSIFNFLRGIPSYIKWINVWEIIGVFAYTQVFALLESIFLLVLIVILAFFIPHKFFMEKFVSQSSILILVVSIWVVFVHYQLELQSLFPSIDPRILLGFWLTSLFITLISLSLLVRRSPRIEERLINIIQKLSILSMFYLFMDALSLVIIITRNLLLLFQ